MVITLMCKELVVTSYKCWYLPIIVCANLSCLVMQR